MAVFLFPAAAGMHPTPSLASGRGLILLPLSSGSSPRPLGVARVEGAGVLAGSTAAVLVHQPLTAGRSPPPPETSRLWHRPPGWTVGRAAAAPRGTHSRGRDGHDRQPVHADEPSFHASVRENEPAFLCIKRLAPAMAAAGPSCGRVRCYRAPYSVVRTPYFVHAYVFIRARGVRVRILREWANLAPTNERTNE